MSSERETSAVVTSIAQGDMAHFKQNVQAWIQLDDQIRALQDNMRTRRKLQKQLTAMILEFMRRHNIEDLNTQNGTLRYHVRLSKPSVNQTTIKNRLATVFEPPRYNEVINQLFNTGEKVEKVSLRRLRVT
jgi:hypothetical protein